MTRANVFTERATALYLPPGVPLDVKAESELEAIVVSAPSSAAGTAVLLGPDDVTVNARGLLFSVCAAGELMETVGTSESSFVIVPVAEPTAIEAFVGSDKSTRNVSSSSIVASPRTVTMIFPDD